VAGIDKNTKKHITTRRKHNNIRRQQMALWNQGKIKQTLMYKAKLKEIVVEDTEESYTSQSCPLCGGKHQANGRKFTCSVHKTEIHRDVNGAQNIARKKYPVAVKTLISVVYKQPVWYKRFLSEKARKQVHK